MKTRIPHILGAGALALTAGTASADQQILDDLIVVGSICAGQDCSNGESFGFDTIRLKENNLRIKFQDTSTSASFPTNDWQITANESSNGGQNKFSIDDIDGGRTPFTIEASAPSHSLYVDDGGRLGFGTSTPVAELHVKDGDTPTLRLEQDGSSGFTPQIFDVAANEANFFVRDATNGSQLPFKIIPGADTNSLVVGADNSVGMGTQTPDARLHVNNGGTDYAATSADDAVIQDDGPARLVLVNTTATNPNWIFNSNDTLRISAGADASEFTLDEDGNLTILGTLTENSNRNAKMAIAPVDTREILDKVAALEVSAWTYKHDAEDGIRHIGPMAQDFHAAFGLGAGPTGISTMDTSGVALAAIRALAEESRILAEENRMLGARIEALESAAQ